MRQRKVKNREQILADCAGYIWHMGDALPQGRPVYLEIGSGKGQFITQKALNDPDGFYLACEGGININVRILQKAKELELSNLAVITDYILKPAEDFAPASLAGLYINFCDPWPKDRHAHRRLTYRELLKQYQVIAKGGFLEFKTDNDALFEWSLEEISAAGLTIEKMTRDLHSSEYAANNVETEYEQKFASTGKAINFVRLAL